MRTTTEKGEVGSLIVGVGADGKAHDLLHLHLLVVLIESVADPGANCKVLFVLLLLIFN